MSFEIGDRLQIDDDICTIRYVGQLEIWKDNTAIGVEWDNPKRGKNSGSINEISYFETDIVGAGSFLKESKVNKSIRRSFNAALQDTYDTPTNVNKNLYISGKQIESIGFEDLNIRNKDIERLESLSLQKCSIFVGFKTNEEMIDISRRCINVRTLNISYNLLNNIQDIFNLIDILPNLRSLNLSGNNFNKGWDPIECSTDTYPNIKQLTLAHCNLNIHRLRYILKMFPSLNTLDISWNTIPEISSDPLEIPMSINTLILSAMSLRYIPMSIASWGVQNIDMSQNDISSISSNKTKNNSTSLRHIDLSFNLINDWSTLDDLNVVFTNLTSLRINNNPIFDNLTDTESDTESVEISSFYMTLARFDKLTILDGSILSSDIKKEAELYFISQIINDKTVYSSQNKRWPYFNEKYGLERRLKQAGSDNSKSDMLLDIKLLKVNIWYKEEGRTFSLTVLSNASVRYLKGIISSKISRSVLNFKLYSMIGVDENLEEIKREFSQIGDLRLNADSTLCVSYT